MLLKVTNLLSFEELEIDFNPLTITSICGANGSGKTSFMELLSIVLYGRFSKKVSNSSLIRYGASEAVGTLNIDWGGLKVQVTRSFSTKEKLDLIVNAENVSGSSINATQAKIDAMFGDYGFFRATTLYSQEDFEPFISSTDSEKKGVLETILQYGDFTSAREKADAKIKELFSELNEVQLELRKNTGASTSLQEELDDLWARLEKEKFRVKISAQELDKEVQALQFKRFNTSVTEGHIMTRRGYIEVDSSKLKELEADYNRFAYRTRKFTGLDVKLALINSKMEELEGQEVSKSCPTCGRDWPTDEIATRIAKRKALLADYTEQRKSVLIDIDNRDRLDSEAIALSTKIAELQDNIRKTTAELADLERKKREMDEHNSKINLQIEVLRSSTANDIKSLKQSIASVEKKLAPIANIIEALTEREKEIATTIKKYEFWYIGFGNGGIKSLLLDKYCSIISDNINYHLGLLTDGLITTSFMATSKTKKGDLRDKINLDVAVGDRHIDYRELSGGQKTLVNLAIMLSLRKLAATKRRLVPVMLFDEVFASLDSDYSMKVAGVLNDVAKEVPIFIVSHHPVLKDFTGSSISFTYENGKTNIKVA